ncbi:SDR family NAD(P)-dependent oxidoreductase [Exilibacterium tricleocarpae]|uniref:SDR family NAD(P)-dependent oxidoreductase n=1 Tax=Exilibacterium tricleocarpae TaxID=2591008 RepID=A0A545U477_9GAMM|nr:type I polyketide synthase [Exilibacterium tricleocarpae]TQV84279.1 SDR family NAD(P)-dependent oxidoreductase [Exilibacterium tricleocarpae]
MINNTKFPIAVIGLGCRFPGGVSSPEQYWEMILNKTDAICEVPEGRWNHNMFYDANEKKVGKSHAKLGGFLQEDIFNFDPIFFGLSPRESEAMDPQQRYLLQTTYEALEDAGQVLDKLKKTSTGVFIGGFTLDNKLTQFGYLNRDRLDSNTATSATMTLLANRLSYVFDLNGTSLTVDTACSSSLVATHLACQSIWMGESELAIAGGVNIMSRPEYSIVMSKGKFLSKHGLCKAFDESAEGYTRGEGCGIAILKPLNKALADGDHIYSVIRNTGSNQDGATKGIAMPNGKSQRKLMERVYGEVDLSSAEIHAVEAHGTGTQAGDTTEANAINLVMSKAQRQTKCLVGSVKTNIGHLEAAAGIAGLIKASLMVNKGKILPNIHFDTPNPKIPFDDMHIRVPTEAESWPVETDTRRVVINSFGYGGTNAHAIVESFTVNKGKTLNKQSVDKMLILPITAQDEAALRKLCEKYAKQISETSSLADFYDILHSASARRTFFKNRACIIGRDKEEICENLLSLSKGQLSENIVLDSSSLEGEKATLAYVFTGMGPQWYAMGAELYEAYPVFKDFVDKADTIFTEISGWSIFSEMQKPESSSLISKTHIAQPANFVLQVGLFKLLEQYGVKPDVITGHSVGEVSAAYVSGMLNLEDALLVSHHRSRLQGTLAGCGSMLAVGLSEAEILPYIIQVDNVEIAAVNSPSSLTIAGKTESLTQLQLLFNDAGIFSRPLTVEVAYHCPEMDPIRDDVLDALKIIKPKTAHTPLYSTVTGELANEFEWDNNYWWKNIRQTVNFSKTIENISQNYHNTIFIEVGPHPVLKNAIKETLSNAGQPVLQAHTLNRKTNECISIRKSIARLFTLGHRLDWRKANSVSGQYVKLPSYPWSLEKYQCLSEKTIEELFGNEGHIFFNRRIDSPTPMWEVEFSHSLFPYAVDHKVEKSVVLPGAAYVEIGLAIAHYHLQSQTIGLEDIQFHNMLADQETVQTFINTSFEPVSGKFKVHSRVMGQRDSWKLHASGRIITNAAPNLGEISLDLSHAEEINVTDFYEKLSAVGLDYGAAFRPITQLKRLSATQVVAQIQQTDNQDDYDKYYLLHPTVLDAAFQTMAEGSEQPYVPVAIKNIYVNQPLPKMLNSLIEITERTDDAVYGNIILFDENKNILVRLDGVKARKFGQSINDKDSLHHHFYDLKWVESRTAEIAPPKISTWLVIGGEMEAHQYIQFFQEHKMSCHSATGMNMIDVDTVLETTPEITDIIYLEQLYGSDLFDNDKILGALTAVKNLVQIIIRKYPQRAVRLFVLTQNSYQVLPEDSPINLLGASFGALAQVVENEHANIAFYCIDVDSDKTLSANMENIFLSKDTTRERAFRGKKLFRHVLDKTQKLTGKNSKSSSLSAQEKPIALRIAETGDVMSLHFTEIAMQPLQATEIKVQTTAVSLNFKDLLKVYNKIDSSITDNTYYKDTLGFEVSGTVVEVGTAVKGFEIGEQVVGLVPDAFRSYANIPAHFATKIPSALSIYEAPTLISYMTAYHSLITLAQLQEGEKVLIHNATGGVGLIALQVAQWKSAEIYATAGSDEKRQYLRDMGIHHIYDSRSLQFAEEIRRDTKGYGIDVVLNAMAGEAVIQSFNLLAPYGRFIEIGKKNIADNNDLPMKAFNENLMFASVDIDRILKHKPALGAEIISQVCGCFEKGHFKPVPSKVFPANNVIDAFQFMSHSKHIGKVVLDFKSQKVDVLLSKNENSKIKSDASYLITGGTKGFGLEIAKWIASQKAGQLILASRSGADDKYSQEEINKLREQGAKVEVIATDVSSEREVQSLINTIKREMLPLRGVFHGAVVLEDNFLAQLTTESLYKVLGPKLIGAVNLHKFTECIPLDIFFCFSSVSALIGNKGQTSYILANAYLDALCHYRRSKGLAGTSINWGAISDVGILSRKTDVAAFFEKFGLSGISPEEAFTIIDQVLENDVTQIGAFRGDWSKLVKSMPSLAYPYTRFTNFLKQDNSDNAIEIARSDFFAKCPKDVELRDYITHNILESISQLLKFPIDKLNKNTSINNMGVDSLVAVELAMIFRQKMGFELSTVDILADPTPEQLSTKLLELLPAEATV